MMKNYKYLIVGGGMAADSAAKAIKKIEPQAEVALFSAESHPPYNRPPLSKGLWGKSSLDSIWLKTEKKGIDLHLNNKIQKLILNEKQVIDQHNNTYSYDKLLLATGGRIRRLPFGEDQVLYFRSLNDYLYLKQKTQQTDNFIVLGGGFIGSEITAALVQQGKKVTIIFPEPSIGFAVFPEGLSLFLNNYYRDKGVRVLSNELAVSILQEGNTQKLITDKQELHADLIVAGIGIIPETTLAEKAGLRTENGILVNQYLQTSHPDIYSAGDVATIYNTILSRNIHYEHEDNAVKMGTIAGKNMTGKNVSYDDYLPYFYSDLFDLGYEAVGVLDSRMSIIEDWQEQYRRGVVYYHEDGKVKGVLLWNVWGALNQAREIIKQTHTQPIEPDKLIGRIKSSG